MPTKPHKKDHNRHCYEPSSLFRLLTLFLNLNFNFLVATKTRKEQDYNHHCYEPAPSSDFYPFFDFFLLHQWQPNHTHTNTITTIAMNPAPCSDFYPPHPHTPPRFCFLFFFFFFFFFFSFFLLSGNQATQKRP